MKREERLLMAGGGRRKNKGENIIQDFKNEDKKKSCVYVKVLFTFHRIEEIEEMRNALRPIPRLLRCDSINKQDRPRGKKRQKMRRHEVSCLLITTTKSHSVFVNSN